MQQKARDYLVEGLRQFQTSDFPCRSVMISTYDLLLRFVSGEIGCTEQVLLNSIMHTPVFQFIQSANTSIPSVVDAKRLEYHAKIYPGEVKWIRDQLIKQNKVTGFPDSAIEITQ